MSDVEQEVRAIIDEVQRDLGVGEEVFIGAGYSFGDALVERFAAALASSRQEVERLTRERDEALYWKRREQDDANSAWSHAKEVEEDMATLQQQVAQVVQAARRAIEMHKYVGDTLAESRHDRTYRALVRLADTLSSSLPDQE